MLGHLRPLYLHRSQQLVPLKVPTWNRENYFTVNNAEVSEEQMKKLLKNYGFLWVTGCFFLISLIGHWVFGWYAYVDEQLSLSQPIETDGYLVEMMRDTMENWQSEFLQLIWQVAGLAMLLHVGSPQSKEGDDRVEAKIDAILLRLDPEGRKTIADLDDKYMGRHTDPYYPHKQLK
jgi:hypothetical protein